MAAVHLGNLVQQLSGVYSSVQSTGPPGPDVMQQDSFGSLQPGNPLLQVLHLAQLAASLPPAPQQAPALHPVAQPYPLGAAPALANLPPAATPTPHVATSGTSSDLPAAAPTGDATAELDAGTKSSFAGLKLPVSCNDIKGVVYLDQQVVACYCDGCEARVAAGHGRPLFSFTRFERHSGSKAKKWRLSIRIDPGAVKEAPADEPPLALGQWLESKGLVSWAPRGGLKLGLSHIGAVSSDDEGSPLQAEDSGGMRRQFAATVAADRRQATVAPRSGAQAGSAAPAANGAAEPGGHGTLLGKRPRQDYVTPDLPQHADRQQWLQSQQAAFDAVVAASDANDSSNPSSSSRTASAKHSAIFGLVYGLLEQGEDRRAFNEVYLPWLNDLPQQRLLAEFATLHSYLRLLDGGMGWEAVRGLMAAYVKAIIAKAAW